MVGISVVVCVSVMEVLSVVFRVTVVVEIEVEDGFSPEVVDICTVLANTPVNPGASLCFHSWLPAVSQLPGSCHPAVT